MNLMTITYITIQEVLNDRTGMAEVQTRLRKEISPSKTEQANITNYAINSRAGSKYSHLHAYLSCKNPLA